MVGGAPVRTPCLPTTPQLGEAIAMTPVVAPAPPRRHSPEHFAPARHAPRLAPVQVVPPTIDRLFPMCEAARDRERQGRPAAQFHGFCRGHAINPERALGGLPNPDGRLSAGRHRCTCPCHAAPRRPAVGVPEPASERP